jgi:hypothetical protein
MAYLAIGHKGDSYTNMRWLPPRLYVNQNELSNIWPYFENVESEDGFVRIPGDNDQAHSLVLSKPSDTIWMHYRAKGSTTSIDTYSFTQRLWTLKNKFGTPVVWLEEDNITYEIRICTVANSVVVNIPHNTLVDIDIKIAYNDFHVYINGIESPLSSPLYIFTDITEIEFGDNNRTNDIFWFYKYFIISEEAMFGHEVKTITPFEHSLDVNEWMHSDIPDFEPLEGKPDIFKQYFSPGGTAAQTFGFEPIKDKGEVKAVQMNAVFHTAGDHKMNFISSVFTNIEEISDDVELKDTPVFVQKIIANDIDLYSEVINYGFKVGKL